MVPASTRHINCVILSISTLEHLVNLPKYSVSVLMGEGGNARVSIRGGGGRIRGYVLGGGGGAEHEGCIRGVVGGRTRGYV